jgi:dTDP-4-dehydrorhamnose reductase
LNGGKQVSGDELRSVLEKAAKISRDVRILAKRTPQIIIEAAALAHVFSGKKGNYTENDVKDGEGFYAQSKSIGEIVNEKDLTIRTSIVGPEMKNGSGLFNWFMNNNGNINGYTNAYWSGVTTIELSNYIDWVMSNDISGLCHLSNNDKITKYDLLKTFNNYIPRDITLNPVECKYRIDKSIINTRKDNNYNVPSYDIMMKNMVSYMATNLNLYNKYLKMDIYL